MSLLYQEELLLRCWYCKQCSFCKRKYAFRSLFSSKIFELRMFRGFCSDDRKTDAVQQWCTARLEQKRLHWGESLVHGPLSPLTHHTQTGVLAENKSEVSFPKIRMKIFEWMDVTGTELITLAIYWLDGGEQAVISAIPSLSWFLKRRNRGVFFLSHKTPQRQLLLCRSHIPLLWQSSPGHPLSL